MKRLVIGLLLAATAFAPLAAGAQRRDAAGQGIRDDNGAAREQRQAARQERRAARAAAQPGLAVQPGAPVQAGARARGPGMDRPRRDRDGDGQPDRRRDHADAPAPVVDAAPRPDRVRPRRDVDAPFLGNGEDAAQRLDRRDRIEGRRDRRQERVEDRRDQPRYRGGVVRPDTRDLRRDRFENRQDRFENRQDRFDDRRDGRDWNGRSADLYRGGQVWNRGWRNDDRYDWNRYRDRNRGAYRLPRYYAPQGAGYGYRRFGIGIQLSRSLFAQNYWLDDPFAYRLPPAYGPYRWVRYHGDALLVDLRTGRVIDVVYDIFY